ncbi:DUF308 domain-containing protein [Shouchella patagoniensis]|uniref:DUF308 domain-containing protein n=1 Tax=Shouchella patagoniensis TaxID=228576 RepID=UPI0009958D92|nr:DUF308 domain-containing protein [Shouchella patagoniensis]
MGFIVLILTLASLVFVVLGIFNLIRYRKQREYHKKYLGFIGLGIVFYIVGIILIPDESNEEVVTADVEKSEGLETESQEDPHSKEGLEETKEKESSIFELTDEMTDDLFESYIEAQAEATYTKEDIEMTFYKGMDYPTYQTEALGNIMLAEAYFNEQTSVALDVVIANDGFIGILNTTDDGITGHVHFDDMYEAKAYFN